LNKIYLFTDYITEYLGKSLSKELFMFKGKKNKSTSKPNAQNKAEQAAIQNPDNPKFSDKFKGKLDD
jgi:hypothetical protein